MSAQVHYGDGRPWDQRADSGPDARVPGWFYNLGITGLRAELVAETPKALRVRYIFPDSPADGRVKVGDFIVGAGGRKFRGEHRNGYGEAVFGADGPILELAQALEDCQGAQGKGRLALWLGRGEEELEVELDVGERYGTFAPTFPSACRKSDLIFAELLTYLVAHQNEDGSFGDPVHDTFAPLALLASGEAKYLPAVERNLKYHCQAIREKDRWLANWYFTSAAIVLAEYHLATGDPWVLRALQEVHDLLAKSQYLDMAQINPKARESHPDSFPKGPKDSHGGWGHNPGFEGYGPIAMLTGQGALAYALMHRCGIRINRRNHDAAYEFLARGTGKNGYVWYGDTPGGGPDNWADMGRTGAAGIAQFLSPYHDGRYRERALSHAQVIGRHPQSFPDTHGSPMMGMAYTALGAHCDADSFRKLMDANRWWFTMAQCHDGSFYYQPNRDNAGYGSDSRLIASSVTALSWRFPNATWLSRARALRSASERSTLTKPPPRKISSWASGFWSDYAARTYVKVVLPILTAAISGPAVLSGLINREPMLVSLGAGFGALAAWQLRAFFWVADEVFDHGDSLDVRTGRVRVSIPLVDIVNISSFGRMLTVYLRTPGPLGRHITMYPASAEVGTELVARLELLRPRPAERPATALEPTAERRISAPWAFGGKWAAIRIYVGVMAGTTLLVIGYFAEPRAAPTMLVLTAVPALVAWARLRRFPDEVLDRGDALCARFGDESVTIPLSNVVNLNFHPAHNEMSLQLRDPVGRRHAITFRALGSDVPEALMWRVDATRECRAASGRGS